MVTLTLVGSEPLTLKPVYPTPAPASDVVLMEGVKDSKKGKSCPRFCSSSSSLLMLVKDIGVRLVALKAFTFTSCSSFLIRMLSCSCARATKLKAKQLAKNNFLIIVMYY